MLFSLKDLASKLSPGPSLEGLHTVKTNAFTLHHFQSLTGMVFVVNSDTDIPGKLLYFSMVLQFDLMDALFFTACRSVP